MLIWGHELAEFEITMKRWSGERLALCGTEADGKLAAKNGAGHGNTAVRFD